MVKNGSSQGFGRVSTHTRPSPYSPMQVRGRLPASQREAPPAAPPRRQRVARRAVFAVALVAALLAGVSYLALFRGPGLPAPRAAEAPAPAATVADEEAQPLARSATAKPR